MVTPKRPVHFYRVLRLPDMPEAGAVYFVLTGDGGYGAPYVIGLDGVARPAVDPAVVIDIASPVIANAIALALQGVPGLPAFDALVEEIAGIQAMLSDIDVRVDGTEASIATIMTAAAALEDRVDAAEVEIAAADVTLTQHAQRIDQLELHDAGVDASLASLDGRVDAIEAIRSSERLSALEIGVVAADADIDSHGTRLTSIEGVDDRQDGEIDALRSEVDDHDTRIAALRTEADDHETRIDALEAGGGGGGDYASKADFDALEARVYQDEGRIDDHEARIEELEAGGGGGGGGGEAASLLLSGLSTGETVSGGVPSPNPPNYPGTTSPFPGNPLYGQVVRASAEDTFEWPSRRYAGDALSGAYIRVLKEGFYSVELSLGSIVGGSGVSINGSGMRVQCTVFTPNGADNFVEHEMIEGGSLLLNPDSDPTATIEQHIRRFTATNGGTGIARCTLRLKAGCIVRFRVAGYSAPPSTARNGGTSIPFYNLPTGGDDTTFNDVVGQRASYLLIRKI